MEKNNTQKKEKNNQKKMTMDWLKQRKALKEQIEEMRQKLQNEFPTEIMLRRPAEAAWQEYDTLRNSREMREDLITKNGKKRLEELRAIYKEEKDKAETALKHRRELNDELTALERKLADLKYVFLAENWSIKELKTIITKSVKPLLDMIIAQTDKVYNLKLKRDKLKVDISSFQRPTKSLDDDALLASTIEKHASGQENNIKLRAQKEAAKDLLQQTESAIEKNKKELEQMRGVFVEALTSVVKEYAQVGAKETAQKLKSILDEDEKFSKAASELLRDLLSKAGASMTPISVHIFSDGAARKSLRKSLVC